MWSRSLKKVASFHVFTSMIIVFAKHRKPHTKTRFQIDLLRKVKNGYVDSRANEIVLPMAAALRKFQFKKK